MAAADQSRVPPGRSILFTSSPVNGAVRARHDQKSALSFWSVAVCALGAARVIDNDSNEKNAMTRARECFIKRYQLAGGARLCRADLLSSELFDGSTESSPTGQELYRSGNWMVLA
jgi:hypothetical protein